MRKRQLVLTLCSVRHASRMKTQRSPDVPLVSLPVWRNLSANESVFSLLLEIESRFRADNRPTSLQSAQSKLGPGRNRRQPRTERLSRYVE
jgi:hypothetical protein